MSVGFELDPVAGEQERPVAPPVGLLWAAAVAFGTGAALLAIGRFLPRLADQVHVVGYALNGLVTVGLVTSFRRIDAERRRSRWYAPRPSMARVAAGLAVATVAVAIAHAWLIADRLAR
jgi:hypothetical protein